MNTSIFLVCQDTSDRGLKMRKRQEALRVEGETEVRSQESGGGEVSSRQSGAGRKRALRAQLIS